MKNWIILLSLCISLIIGTRMSTFAQKQNKWNLGVSAGYGKDFFHRKFHVPKATILPPGWDTHFISFHSLKTALFVERFLKPRWSLRLQTEYSVVEMPNYEILEISHQGWYEKNERDHWVALSLGVWKYFKTEKPVKIFADIGVQGDYFLGYRNFPHGYSHKFNWGAEDYSRFAPSVYAGVGCKWKRFTISADYQTNIARTMEMYSGKEYDNRDFTKRSLTRQGISVKASFLLIKAAEKWY